MSVNLCVWALARFQPSGMLIMATKKSIVISLSGSSKWYNCLDNEVFTSVACCQLDLSCFPIPLAFYVYIILLFWVTVSCCFVPRILFAAGLIICINWRFKFMFRDLISTLSSWAKSLLSTSGSWCSFLESLVQYTSLDPSLLWGGPEDRSQGLFPSPGRQLPIEAVSDLVALFFAHLADTSFLTPADSLWLLVPVAGNPVLQMLPLLCCGSASPDGLPVIGLSWPSTWDISMWGHPQDFCICFADEEIEVP